MSIARNIFIAFFSISILLVSCNEKKGNAKDIFTKVYSTDSIVSQSFVINSNRDTTIKGASGTILRIYKNTFIDNTGKFVSGDINFVLKEVFSPSDIILGNLTTTSNGKNLESGGMFYLDATSNGTQVTIAIDKIIGVLVPRNNEDNEMKIYEGEKDSFNINWVNPNPILNNEIKRKEFEQVTITWFPSQNTSEAEQHAIGDTLIKNFRSVQNDTTVSIGNKKVQMLKPIKRKIIIDTANGNEIRFMDEVLLPKGTNMFAEDYNTNYIFSIKKLGWANIDKLYDDPRTKEVDLITTIENNSDFNSIYVSLIIGNKKMYIPGYQKLDNTFSFTHNDLEKAALPIGETATILATSYKNGKPFFAIKKIKITAKQTVNFKLIETTMENFKIHLNSEI